MTEAANSEISNFNEAMRAEQVEPGLWAWAPSNKWRQGRTIFGGITVASVANAMIAEVRSQAASDASAPKLRTIQYSFAAPLLADKPVAFEVKVDRRGSSATFVSAAITQDDAVVGRANAVFGVSRDSKLRKSPSAPALDKSLEEAFEFPYVEGITPVFTQQLEMRWGVDELPLQSQPEGIVGGYMRYRSAVSGTPAIVALLDVWPPSVITMVDKPTMASSVSLTMHLLDEDPQFSPDDWFEFKYETLSASEGYATELGYLSLNGRVIGWVEQLVAIFDDRS